MGNDKCSPVLWSYSSARRQQLVTLTEWSDTSTRRDLGQMHPVYSCIICSIWAYCYLLHCKSVAIILLRIWFVWINALSAPLTVRLEDFTWYQERSAVALCGHTVSRGPSYSAALQDCLSDSMQEYGDWAGREILVHYKTELLTSCVKMVTLSDSSISSTSSSVTCFPAVGGTEGTASHDSQSKTTAGVN